MKRLMKFRTNDSGAIEGLPLQLLIMVIIAGVGIAIVIGWMSFSKTDVGSVSADPNTIEVTKAGGTANKTITITVLDQNNKALKDATVKISGCGVDTIKKTGTDGKATFDITATLPTGTNTGEITVEASYDSTWGKTIKRTSIAVNRAS
jgi:hypothetical protein